MNRTQRLSFYFIVIQFFGLAIGLKTGVYSFLSLGMAVSAIVYATADLFNLPRDEETNERE